MGLINNMQVTCVMMPLHHLKTIYVRYWVNGSHKCTHKCKCTHTHTVLTLLLIMQKTSWLLGHLLWWCGCLSRCAGCAVVNACRFIWMRVGSCTPTTVLVLFLMAETIVTTLSPLTQQNLPFHIDRERSNRYIGYSITIYHMESNQPTTAPLQAPPFLTQSAAGHETMKEWVIHPCAVLTFCQSRVGDTSYCSIWINVRGQACYTLLDDFCIWTSRGLVNLR